MVALKWSEKLVRLSGSKLCELGRRKNIASCKLVRRDMRLEAAWSVGWWALQDSNLRPNDYESFALTN